MKAFFKKEIRAITLLILSIAFVAESYANGFWTILQAPASLSAPADLLFFWTCESTTFGADDYSAADDTPTTGSGAVVSTTYYKTGSNGIEIPTEYDYFSFTITDIFDGTSGVVGFWFYPDTITNSTQIFRASNATNSIWLAHDGTEIYASFNTTTMNTSGAGIAADAWYFVQYSYDSAHATQDWHRIEIWDAAGTKIEDITDNEALTGITTASGNIFWGNNSGGDTVFGLDVVMISNEPSRDLHAWAAADAYEDTYE